VNILVLLTIGLIVFYLGYRFYGKFMSGVFGEDDSKVTPANQLKDGRDYVPTPLGVAFSHHFSSIAGAGPIVGPTTALLFGFAPVWFWIILGTVFIGAVHDYTALFTSMREKVRSDFSLRAQHGEPAPSSVEVAGRFRDNLRHFDGGRLCGDHFGYCGPVKPLLIRRIVGDLV
jgi:carbon starvation protein